MSTPDLDDVGDLCRLALAARRLGCRVRIEGASDDLRDLLVLAGVGSLLTDEPPATHRTGADLR
ncbi:hypothetical protein [Actinospongicola halichondriae]|uniref:hypothetical protein n=1 Tax=Actinospongicola halichondriae TaxID=3236844 RepID=UPI003D450E6C